MAKKGLQIKFGERWFKPCAYWLPTPSSVNNGARTSNILSGTRSELHQRITFFAF